MMNFVALPSSSPVSRLPAAAGALRVPDMAGFIAWSVVLVLAYVAVDAASFLFWAEPIPGKLFNPQAGVAVGLLYAGGIRYAAPLFVAAWLAEWLLRHPGAPLLQFTAALAVTLSFAVTAVALRARTLAGGVSSLPSVRDFLLIAAVGAALSAAAYSAAYALVAQGSLENLRSSLYYQWLGDVAGIVIVTPVVILTLLRRAAPVPVRGPGWLDAGIFIATLVAIIAFLLRVEPQAAERLSYLLFIPLIVLAMRRGFLGAALGVPTVQVAVLVWLWLSGQGFDDAAANQMLMLVLGVTTLLLGAVAGERRHALDEVARRSAELRAQQQALSDAMRVTAASETASTLAHEMSQPLSAIGTYARAALEMLRRGVSTSEQLTGIMERIVAESARTRESVQRIRDFFRSGGVRREPVDLAVLAADVADALRDRMRAGGITFAADVPRDLDKLWADRVQLGIVLHNLVVNAADAVGDAPAPRWIRIAARECGSFVEVDVADSGPGIDESVRGALFEPLATTKPAGMGLGLAISRTLILAHGGRLELKQTAPTTFRFTLPIHGNAS
ncbi:MAG TPA: ATP-binding protein [Casimicrobiaceae bacterium]|nr:ATP-binding protein [Casimicrobiaceae bacterium]